VPPEDGRTETERIDEPLGLDGGCFMKTGVEGSDGRRSAVAAAIGNENAIAIRQRRDLPIERVDLVAPPAMQEDERRASPELAIPQAYRRHAGRERRFGQLHDVPSRADRHPSTRHYRP